MSNSIVAPAKAKSIPSKPTKVYSVDIRRLRICGCEACDIESIFVNRTDAVAHALEILPEAISETRDNEEFICIAVCEYYLDESFPNSLAQGLTDSILPTGEVVDQYDYDA